MTCLGREKVSGSPPIAKRSMGFVHSRAGFQSPSDKAALLSDKPPPSAPMITFPSSSVANSPPFRRLKVICSSSNSNRSCDLVDPVGRAIAVRALCVVTSVRVKLRPRIQALLVSPCSPFSLRWWAGYIGSAVSRRGLVGKQKCKIPLFHFSFFVYHPTSVPSPSVTTRETAKLYSVCSYHAARNGHPCSISLHLTHARVLLPFPLSLHLYNIGIKSPTLHLTNTTKRCIGTPGPPPKVRLLRPSSY